MELTVATKVRLGTITSSPGRTPAPKRAKCKAAVPLDTARACFTPTNLAKRFSNSEVTSPMESQRDFRTRLTAFSSTEEISMSERRTFQFIGDCSGYSFSPLFPRRLAHKSFFFNLGKTSTALA